MTAQSVHTPCGKAPQTLPVSSDRILGSPFLYCATSHDNLINSAVIWFLETVWLVACVLRSLITELAQLYKECFLCSWAFWQMWDCCVFDSSALNKSQGWVLVLSPLSPQRAGVAASCFTAKDCTHFSITPVFSGISPALNWSLETAQRFFTLLMLSQTCREGGRQQHPIPHLLMADHFLSSDPLGISSTSQDLLPPCSRGS